MVKTLPCSGCFTACMSAHFRVVNETGICGSDDSLWHGSKWVADSIELQLTSLRRIDVLACSFDTGFNSAYFDDNLCNKGDGKCNDPSSC